MTLFDNVVVLKAEEFKKLLANDNLTDTQFSLVLLIEQWQGDAEGSDAPPGGKHLAWAQDEGLVTVGVEDPAYTNFADALFRKLGFTKRDEAETKPGKSRRKS